MSLNTGPNLDHLGPLGPFKDPLDPVWTPLTTLRPPKTRPLRTHLGPPQGNLDLRIPLGHYPLGLYPLVPHGTHIRYPHRPPKKCMCPFMPVYSGGLSSLCSANLAASLSAVIVSKWSMVMSTAPLLALKTASMTSASRSGNMTLKVEMLLFDENPHTEFRLRSFGYRVSISEFWLPSFDYRVSVTEFRLPSFWLPSFGFTV